MRLVIFSLSHWYPSTTIVYQAFLLSVGDHCFHTPPPFQVKAKSKATREVLLPFPTFFFFPQMAWPGSPTSPCLFWKRLAHAVSENIF